MCGICGIASGAPRDAINPSVLRAMNAVLVHRGPDDGGEWHGGHIGLAMRRLRVIDPEGGQQPMTILGGDLVLVFNGEIYNYQELRTELQKLGAEFNTESDTEVILWGYEKWGGKLLDRLNGMFAFALYDRRHDRLLIARDRLGIKPLYYTLHNGQFAFASELESLRRSRLLSDGIDPAALDAYLEFGFVPAPDTIYTDAKKLLPGELLVYENGGIATERYWRVEWDRKQEWTPRTAAIQYRRLLEESVAAQRVADVPLGAFLSGGIDSSSVVAILARLSDMPIKTFTIGFDDAAMDETRYARMVAERYGTEHHERFIRPDTVSLLPKLVRHFGEPFADSSAIPTYLVSRLARAHVTVALSGDGGDELFAGYAWMHMDRRVRRYRFAPRFIRRAVDKALFVLPGGIRAEKVRRFSRDSFLEPYLSFRRRHATQKHKGHGHKGPGMRATGTPISMPWHVLPRKAARVEASKPVIAAGGDAITLRNTGVGTAQNDAYSLLLTLPDQPRGGPGEGLPNPSVRAFGVQTYLVPDGFCSAPDGTPDYLMAFAFNLWERQAYSLWPGLAGVYLDVNGDGAPDYDVFNLALNYLGSTGDWRTVTVVTNLATGLSDAFFFTEHAHNSANQVLLVCDVQIGKQPFFANMEALVYVEDASFGSTFNTAPATFAPLGERYFSPDVPDLGAGQSGVMNVVDFGEAGTNPGELGLLLFTNGDRGAGARGGATPGTEAILLPEGVEEAEPDDGKGKGKGKGRGKGGR